MYAPSLGWLLEHHLGMSRADVAFSQRLATRAGLCPGRTLTVEGRPAGWTTPVPWGSLVRVGRQLYRLRRPAGLCRLTNPEPWDILPEDLEEGVGHDGEALDCGAG